MEFSSPFKAVFVRVGWMRFFTGSTLGDERPIGGGSYNRTRTGGEIYNFRATSGRLYGYFRPAAHDGSISLDRIDPASGSDTKSLKDVLVVFIARRPTGGQVVVGWYRHATVFQNIVARSPGKPKGYGHYCSARESKCVLVPTESRRFSVPSGKDGMGQANVRYIYDSNLRSKMANWMLDALSYIETYEGGNLLISPEQDAEEQIQAAAEEALAKSCGQGFVVNAEQRRAIELRAMVAARKHFVQAGYKVTDVSKSQPYDLKCVNANSELHVEVKGTTTDGRAIILTRNEVDHALSPKHVCVLFVLHSIRLKAKHAVGGKMFIAEPWSIRKDLLKPISYVYRLPECDQGLSP